MWNTGLWVYPDFGTWVEKKSVSYPWAVPLVGKVKYTETAFLGSHV